VSEEGSGTPAGKPISPSEVPEYIRRNRNTRKGLTTEARRHRAAELEKDEEKDSDCEDENLRRLCLMACVRGKPRPGLEFLSCQDRRVTWLLKR
jgi:hypothetical protein